MYDMTAAHPTLPFHTLVRVTNLENGKRVEVRINDRGPFIEGRVIDLSYTGAQKIDMLGRGRREYLWRLCCSRLEGALHLRELSPSRWERLPKRKMPSAFKGTYKGDILRFTRCSGKQPEENLPRANRRVPNRGGSPEKS